MGLTAKKQSVSFSGFSGPGIVVDFGGVSRLIFWENANHIPCWDLGGDVWMFNEWFETGSTENKHCYEPMMDAENHYSRAEIVVNGPARTVVHWHYALCDNQYRIFNGNTTADEYYTTYPDGVTLRKLVGWPGDNSDFGGNGTYWEVGEWNILEGIGNTPDQTVDSPVLTLRNIVGESVNVYWPSPYPPVALCEIYPRISGWQEYVGVLRMKNRPTAYAIIPGDQLLFPHLECSHCGKPHIEFKVFGGNLNTCNHWPMYNKDDWVGWREAHDQVGKTMTTTGFMSYGYAYNVRRTVSGNPLATRGLSVSGNWRNARPPRPTTWVSINGVTAQEDDNLLTRIAASWLRPAEVETDWVFDGYAYAQKAYVFRPVDKASRSFHCVVKPASALLNPVFILEGAPHRIKAVRVDGQNVDRFEHQIENESSTVVWIDTLVTHNSVVELQFA